MFECRMTVCLVRPKREKNSHIFSVYNLVQPIPKYAPANSSDGSRSDSLKASMEDGYITLGDIITILGVNARPGLEGKLDLVLTPYSKIIKKN